MSSAYRDEQRDALSSNTRKTEPKFTVSFEGKAKRKKRRKQNVSAPQKLLHYVSKKIKITPESRTTRHEEVKRALRCRKINTLPKNRQVSREPRSAGQKLGLPDWTTQKAINLGLALFSFHSRRRVGATIISGNVPLEK